MLIAVSGCGVKRGLSEVTSPTLDIKYEHNMPDGSWCVQLVGFRAEKELGCLQDWESQCDGLNMKSPKGSCIEGLAPVPDIAIRR